MSRLLDKQLDTAGFVILDGHIEGRGCHFRPSRALEYARWDIAGRHRCGKPAAWRTLVQSSCEVVRFGWRQIGVSLRDLAKPANHTRAGSDVASRTATLRSMTDTASTPAATDAPASGGRVFSGVQPSGLPHIGNHLGAFRNYIAMQDGYDAIYCIVDYHALTSTHDAELIRRSTHEMALGLLALGLDPERAVLFRQSDRPEHLELMWLLASVTPTGWVERTPSFKEKRRSQPDDVNLALLNYPVLQAADIAIYKASYVPVGKDQAAHLELAREIVRAFNSRYGETFPEPQAVFSEAPIVKGTDGANKMSKSMGNVIEIFPTRSGSAAPTPDGRRFATCVSCTGSSVPTTTKTSGMASAPLGPAASIPRSCCCSGC